MKVALYQNNPIFGEIRANVDTVVAAVRNKEFDILVLPELFATGYQFRDREEAFMLADSIGTGYTFETLAQLAAQKNSLVIYGFPEKRGREIFNSAAGVFPDRKFQLYQKTHLFDTEKEIFSQGQTGFSVFSFRETRIGMMICFDWRFPESARKLALLGAQVICHPSNLVLPHCPDAMITRALENCVFTITANRIGSENRGGKRLQFIGHSRILAPTGKILAELDDIGEGFIIVDINPKLADNKSVTERNDVIKDRRPEFY